MSLGKLLVRTDASPAVGTGHAMRCLALAEAWRSGGGDVVFAMAEKTPAIADRIAETGSSIREISAVPGSDKDLACTKALIAAEAPAWVVLDGYRFEANYQLEIARIAALIVIDDNGLIENYAARFVLNQNVHANEGMYARKSPSTRLLLGPRYALLRTEFAAYRDWKRQIAAPGKNILVSMGGSDPLNLTPQILQSLTQSATEGVKIRVAVGGSAENADAVKKIAQRYSSILEVGQDARDMAGLMAWADVGIVGAGSTVWETCCLGLPSILIVVAENQKLLAAKLDNMGVALHAGPAEDLDCDRLAGAARSLLDDATRRMQMSVRSRKLVDGRGRERLLVFLDRNLRIRKAHTADSLPLWEWANDPVTRQASFASDPISWESHVSWFEEQTENPKARIYIVEHQAEPVGTVRFRVGDQRATLSINLAPSCRGKGLGAKALWLAVEELFQTTGIAAIDAYVKPDNSRSLELFRAAGFEESGFGEVKGQKAARFVLERWGIGE